MAEHSLAIRFGLENGAVVLRDLKAIGGNGEKALKRIEQAGKPASRALQGVSAVAGDLRGRFENMASGLCPLGAGLMRLGPIGLGVAGAIGAAVVAVGKLVSKGAETMAMLDDLDDAAQQLGISGEKLQKLQIGFELTGVKPEAVTAGLTKLNDAIGEVLIKGKEASKETQLSFGKLGITYDEVKKHGEDLPWMLNNIADGLARLPTTAEKITVLRNIFGKQGGAMLQYFDQGSKKISEFEQKLVDMGFIVPEAVTKTASETNDQIAAINKGIDSQWVRLSQGFWDWNKDFKLGWMEVLRWTADKNDEINKQWAEDWEWQKKTAAAAWEWLKGGWASLTGALGEGWQAFTSGVGKAWDTATAAVGEVWDQVSSRLGKAWDASVARNKKAWDDMVAGLEKVCPGAVAAIQRIWDGLKDYWRRLSDALGSGWDALTGRLGEKWRRFIDGLPIPGAVRRWLGMDTSAPPPTGATGTIPDPGASPPATAPLVPGGSTSPPGPRQGPPTGATGTFGPMQQAPAGKRPPVGRSAAAGRAAPASAPARRSARPQQQHAALDIGGGVDINVRGPAEVRRVRSRDPRVPVAVNQGWSMVG